MTYAFDELHFYLYCRHPHPHSYAIMGPAPHSPLVVLHLSGVHVCHVCTCAVLGLTGHMGPISHRCHRLGRAYDLFPPFPSLLPIMGSEGRWELWRTSLCRHGSCHTMRGCAYAHSLSELRPPDESCQSYGDQWRLHRMDRFYGQVMSSEQLDRIRWYFDRTPQAERPLWAIGLYLLVHRRESQCGYAYPWDFGIARDYDDLLERRFDRGCPFSTYPMVWERLQRRRERMIGYVHPPHILGVTMPSGVDEVFRNHGEEHAAEPAIGQEPLPEFLPSTRFYTSPIDEIIGEVQAGGGGQRAPAAESTIQPADMRLASSDGSSSMPDSRRTRAADWLGRGTTSPGDAAGGSMTA